MSHLTVTFRDLTVDEMDQLLKSTHVGRLAFTQHDRVDIEPIHFVYMDGALYGRTAPGTKLSVLAHYPWVAFEIDDVRGPMDWRSVVVKGTVYFVERGQASVLANAYDHAVSVIRTLMPDAFTENDPVPARTIIFRLHIHSMSGRAASSSGLHANEVADEDSGGVEHLLLG